MYLATLVKGANDLIDFEFDFGRWLPEGDAITGATASFGASTAMVVQDAAHDPEIVRVWIDGGTAGEANALIVEITTSQGRRKNVAAQIRVEEVAS